MTEFTLVDQYGVPVGYESFCGIELELEPVVMPYRIRGRACPSCLEAFAAVMSSAA